MFNTKEPLCMVVVSFLYWNLGHLQNILFFVLINFSPLFYFFSLLALHAKFNLRQFRYWYRHLCVFISSEQQEKEEREKGVSYPEFSSILCLLVTIWSTLKNLSLPVLLPIQLKFYKFFTKLNWLRFSLTWFRFWFKVNSIISTKRHR